MSNQTTGNSVWEEHLLLQPPPPQPVNIACTFKVWNNVTLKHEHLGAGVTITIEDPITQVKTSFTTTASGKISGPVMCRLGRSYRVTAEIAQLTFGLRTYTENPHVGCVAEMKGGQLSLLPSELIVPRLIEEHYRKTMFTTAQHPNWIIEYDIEKAPRIRVFEESYKADNFNILIEGDSWFDSFSSPLDIYDYIKQLLEQTSTKPNKKVSLLPLQNWGQTAETMLVDNGANSQRRYLLEYLSKYRFDLILLSCGGNDFALSFDTFLNSGLTPAGVVASAKAIKAAHPSLAIDLDYHPTFFFGTDLGAVATYVNSVVGNAFDTITFPNYSTGKPYEDMINLIYDRGVVETKFFYMEDWLEDIVYDIFHKNYHNLLGVPIISHSYSYPAYSDAGVFLLDGPFLQDGPFIHPALEAAGVENPVLQALCIKALIDAHKRHVLDEVVSKYPTWFHYADVRQLVLSSDDWADEMHLTATGSAKVAKAIYAKIKSVLPGMFTP